MSLRFSIGNYWFELYLLFPLMVGAIIYFQIKYGHGSNNNLIKLSRDCKRYIWLKIGNKNSRELIKGE